MPGINGNNRNKGINGNIGNNRNNGIRHEPAMRAEAWIPRSSSGMTRGAR
jgi:hypothetical protein